MAGVLNSRGREDSGAQALRDNLRSDVQEILERTLARSLAEERVKYEEALESQLRRWVVPGRGRQSGADSVTSRAFDSSQSPEDTAERREGRPQTVRFSACRTSAASGSDNSENLRKSDSSRGSRPGAGIEKVIGAPDPTATEMMVGKAYSVSAPKTIGKTMKRLHQRANAWADVQLRRPGDSMTLHEESKKSQEEPDGGTTTVFQRSALSKLVHSTPFAIASALLIIGNAVHLGMYANHAAKVAVARLTWDPDSSAGIWYGNIVFGALFTVEVGLRIAGEGWAYVDGGTDLGWNILDVFLVGATIVSWMASGFRLDFVSSILFGRTVRVLHVIQHLPVFRTPFFSQLRIMMCIIQKCFPSLFWFMCVGFFCLYVFSVPFTIAIAENLESLRHAAASSDPSGDGSMLTDKFQTLSSSFTTLFMLVSSGADWGEFYYMFQTMGPQWGLCFIFYVVFVLYAFLNIVTGIFVERSFKVVEHDPYFKLCEDVVEQSMYEDKVRALFRQLDTDGDDTLSWEEFQAGLNYHPVQMYFKWLGIDTSQAERMFRLIDRDNSGRVDLAEFFTGCAKLRGSATTMDVKSVHHDFINMIDKLQRYAKPDHQGALIQDIEALFFDLHQSLSEEIRAAGVSQSALAACPYSASAREKSPVALDAKLDSGVMTPESTFDSARGTRKRKGNKIEAYKSDPLLL